MTGLSAYIADLAKRHDVAYVKTASSALAQVFTRLAGDDGNPDETEKLVIALRRANVINLETAVGCARVCRERRAGQGETKQRTLVRNEEQRRQDRRARCNRVHSAVT